MEALVTLGFHMPRTTPTPGCAFVAGRDFPYDSHAIKDGTAFPPAGVDVPEWKLIELWRAGYIEVARPAAPAAPAMPPAAANAPSPGEALGTSKKRRPRATV